MLQIRVEVVVMEQEMMLQLLRCQGVKPIILAILTTHQEKNAPIEDSLIAEISRLVYERLEQ